jgi:hypothetical protein
VPDNEFPWVYYVAYSWTNGRMSGVGCIEIMRSEPISSYADVASMADMARDRERGLITQATVMNYRLVSGPEGYCLSCGSARREAKDG